MEATGRGVRKILFIAEAPGATEDRNNTQLVGESGRALRYVLKRLDVDLDYCRKINAVNCRPPMNRTPKNGEIDACRPMVTKEIEDFSPNVIVPMGSAAIRSVLGLHPGLSEGTNEKGSTWSVTKWRGWAIPDTVHDAWIIPTYHPSYILRTDRQYKGKNPARLFWQDDLEKAVTYETKYHRVWQIPADKVETDILGKHEAIRALRGMLVNPPDVFAFDYETTGLKPHAPGHRIVSCSFSWVSAPAAERTFAFMVNDDPAILKLLKRVLSLPSGKIAANNPFEELWTREILGIGVVNWVWDVVLSAHILDNRRGCAGVKFQTYVNFGEPDYASSVASKLKTSDESGNGFNRIDDIPERELLRYNALDSYYEYKLAMLQMQRTRTHAEYWDDIPF